MKPHWQTIQIFDEDGGHPDEETRIEKLREYRDCDCMDGYFLVDPREHVHPWDAGPSVDEIDWTGFPEE